MEGWVPMHGELHVLDRAYRLESSGWLWRAVGGGCCWSPVNECDAGLGRKTREGVRGHPARGCAWLNAHRPEAARYSLVRWRLSAKGCLTVVSKEDQD